MSTGTTSGRNRLLVPAVAGAIVLLIIIGFLVVRGGDEEPAAAKTTKPAATTAAPKAPQAKVAGSGVAPEAIAVKTATVARGASVFAIGAELPKIDIKKIDTVTLVLAQDNGALWRLRTLQDARGGFVIPQLYLVKGVTEEQFACTAGMRIKGPQLTMTIPLKCLDNPQKPLRARLEITDRDGGQEKTSNSKTLKAPKA